MRSAGSFRRTRILASHILAFSVTFTGLGLVSFAALGGEIKDSTSKPRVAKFNENQATQIALKRVPGQVTSVVIERKRGHNVYVVEILAAKNGAETDVFVDIETGKVVGTE